MHFGIFGFTGAGKSNIVSTYVTKLLETAQNRHYPIKIVLFDLMSEYTVLLADQLFSLQDAYLLGIGEFTFPRSVIEFLSGEGERGRATIDLLNTGLYPKSLERNRGIFQPLFDSLLDQNKIRIYQELTRTFRDFLRENEALLTRGNLGGARGVINAFIENMRSLEGQPISTELIQNVIIAVKQLIRGNIGIQTEQEVTTLESFIDTVENSRERSTQISGSNLLMDVNLPKQGLTQTAIGNLKEFRRVLERERTRVERTYPSDAVLSLGTIIEYLNNYDNSSLFIIQSHDLDALRDFASTLGDRLLENRRTTGATSPLVSFVFDEADEFIRQQYERDSSYAHSFFR